MEFVLSKCQIFLMDAGVEINMVYEKFVSIFAYLVGCFERPNVMEAKFPLLSNVSIFCQCRLIFAV